jgi:hypothetical protein
VTKVIVRFSYQLVSFGFVDIDLVSTLRVSAPQLVFEYEELRRVIDERLEL